MSILNTAVAIITISNPIANLPIYLSLTDGDRNNDRAIARSAALTFLITLLAAVFFGDELLNFFGISRGAFQVTGGLILLLIGISMVRTELAKEFQDMDHSNREGKTVAKGVVPLGIPLSVGPGTLSVVIADPNSGTTSGRVALSAVVVVLAILTYLIFMLGRLLSDYISFTTMEVITKLMGLVLSALAIEILFAGLRSSFPQLVFN